jgi:SAM-dependent methyltransferase
LYRPHELLYLIAEPGMTALYGVVGRDLRRIVARCRPHDTQRLQVLDIGGRKSGYTIGLNADITILDLPRTTDRQKQLQLGLTQNITEQIKRRRSNVIKIVLGDVTANTLPAASFDVVVAVEVIEHVQRDADFVRAAARLLRKNGVCYLTTPNGEAVPNTNPDHVRHYTEAEFHSVLSKAFDDAQVRCAVKTGRIWQRSLRPRKMKHPIATAVTMGAAYVNRRQRVRSPKHAAHLIAECTKSQA